MARSADAVIVGGGIMGVSIAWHLVQRGMKDVFVLERETIAAGASGRTGALLRQHYTNRPEAILAHRSHQVFRHWAEIVGGDCGYVPQGLVVTIATGQGHERNIDLLHRNVSMQRAIGIEARVISAADLQSLQPFTYVDDLAAVAYEPTSGYVDAIAATRTMARAAIRAGAVIIEGTSCQAIEMRSHRIEAVRTNDERIATGTVVCATGPWTPKLLAPLGVELPIKALRVQIAIVQRPLELEPDPFVYIDTSAGMFTRPWGPGRSLIGVGGGDQHDEVDPDCYEERNDAHYPTTAIRVAAKRIPAMAHARYLHGHGALYDMTPDAHPIIGQVGPDGLYVAAGFSGAGFKKGPAVGEALAELITDGRSSFVDLLPFQAARFDNDAWHQPWSETEYTFASDFGHKF